MGTMAENERRTTHFDAMENARPQRSNENKIRPTPTTNEQYTPTIFDGLHCFVYVYVRWLSSHLNCSSLAISPVQQFACCGSNQEAQYTPITT